MNWARRHKAVAPPKGSALELVGWVTLDNQSGRTFRDAHVKLMAGDVNKVQPPQSMGMAMGAISNFGSAGRQFGPPVTEKTFDEYHLYTLEHATTPHDRETKQVEFVRAAGIQSQTVYVYDGFKIDPNYRNWTYENIRQQESYGTLSNPEGWEMQEFKNSTANHLGMTLPKERVRFYRRDDDGQLQLTGEKNNDPTPQEERIPLDNRRALFVSREGRRNKEPGGLTGPRV